jgi:biofilm PGA synthesis protein PgaD
MRDIIINRPELQSFRQKCSSVFLSSLSWLLWLYFLIPLFTLGGWLLGVKNLSDEIRWFGGYKTLLELLTLYGEIIVLIAILWMVWALLMFSLHGGEKPDEVEAVSDIELCSTFNLELAILEKARAAKMITVYFDDHALITALDSHDMFNSDQC